MKRLSISLRVMFTLLVITMLAACAPGETGPSAEEVAAQVATSVAMTIEAQAEIATSVALTVEAREAEAAAALPTATQTATPLPTLTPVLNTATPVTLTDPSGGSGGGSSGGYTQYDYSCDIIRQRPRDNTEFKRNSGTFDVSFVILNNGTKTWETGKDVVLLGDPGGSLGIAPGTLVLQLGEMKPGDTSAVIGPFDATVPDEPGHYVIDFKVEGGWCYPYVAFNVVR